MKLKIVLFFIIFTVSFGEVVIEYQELPSQEVELKEWMKRDDVLDEEIEIINDEFNIDEELRVVLGNDEGVYYDPNTKIINISYDFLEEAMIRFQETYSEEWEIYLEDVLEHTLYHELGHALVDIFDIPVLGKEEDAVDDFGVIMLILTSEDGDERSISAAEMFFLEGEDIEELTPDDLMDEHSLSEQRGYRSLYLVYGSNPNKYEELAEELELDEERKEMAIEIYERQVYNWLRMLRPYIKDGILSSRLVEE